MDHNTLHNKRVCPSFSLSLSSLLKRHAITRSHFGHAPNPHESAANRGGFRFPSPHATSSSSKKVYSKVKSLLMR